MLADTSENIEKKYQNRRETVFLVLAGIFLGTLGVLNILGISRQIDLSFYIFDTHIPFVVFVGVLPYPITFLCTDLISEIFGRTRANRVVWVGLILNIWVLFILWLGGVLPPAPELGNDGLPLVDDASRTFFQIRKWTFSATIASMAAYLTAQFIDVHIFHYVRKLTKGKHLWLRNNVSTLTSQLVDSIAVTYITFFFSRNAIQIDHGKGIFYMLIVIVLSNYFFKMISALLDTLPFYFFTRYLNNYLGLKQDELH